VAFDAKNVEHLKWVTQHAQERAAKFGVEGTQFSVALLLAV
jgi:hypothetical protein